MLAGQLGLRVAEVPIDWSDRARQPHAHAGRSAADRGRALAAAPAIQSAACGPRLTKQYLLTWRTGVCCV